MMDYCGTTNDMLVLTFLFSPLYMPFLVDWTLRLIGASEAVGMTIGFYILLWASWFLFMYLPPQIGFIRRNKKQGDEK